MPSDQRMLPHSGTDITSLSDPECLSAGEGTGRGLGEGRRYEEQGELEEAGRGKREEAPKDSQTEEKTIN